MVDILSPFISQAGLVRAAAASETSTVNYIKPLQCGGSDESFVLQHDRQSQSKINSQTLFSWNTPASPHLASRWENLPVSDDRVISSLAKSLERIINSGDEEVQLSDMTSTIIESAGGAMSPSSSSPENNSTISEQWGWSTQADLYSSLKIPVVFVGDARLGGISVTLSTLEALWNRGYIVDAVIFVEQSNDSNAENQNTISYGEGNSQALKEYVIMRKSEIDEDAILLLPKLPPMPEPLDVWYDENRESFANLHRLLSEKWHTRFS